MERLALFVLPDLWLMALAGLRTRLRSSDRTSGGATSDVRAACPPLHLKVFEGNGESAHPRGTTFARVWQAPIGQEGVSQGRQQAKHVVNTLKFRRSALGSPKFVAEVSESSHNFNFVCCLYGEPTILRARS